MYEKEGWLYLAVIINLYSRKIAGWTMDQHMKIQLAFEAWITAFFGENLKPA